MGYQGRDGPRTFGRFLQMRGGVCNVLDRSHERAPAAYHMPLGRGAGDQDRRMRRERAGLDHNQVLGSALIDCTRAKEAVRRARAYKELANPALNDAHVDGFGPGWPNIEKHVPRRTDQCNLHTHVIANKNKPPR